MEGSGPVLFGRGVMYEFRLVGVLAVEGTQSKRGCRKARVVKWCKIQLINRRCCYRERRCLSNGKQVRVFGGWSVRGLTSEFDCVGWVCWTCCGCGIWMSRRVMFSIVYDDYYTCHYTVSHHFPFIFILSRVYGLEWGG